jgi:hypothetical protein
MQLNAGRIQMVFTKGGTPGNPNGRPKESKNKVTMANIESRLATLEQNVASIQKTRSAEFERLYQLGIETTKQLLDK